MTSYRIASLFVPPENPEAPIGAVNSLDFHGSGEMLVSSSDDGRVVVHDVAKGGSGLSMTKAESQASSSSGPGEW